MANKCFGIVSWFPDEIDHRIQRIDRLNNTFKQLIDLFGEDIEFLIVAQNWRDYTLPTFVKNTTIFNYNKLGILGARNMLRKHFLESKYDYLIMCDDDIMLEELEPGGAHKFLDALDEHPDGFTFIQYGWSLTFCAVSRYIYAKDPIPDVDPEKNEGYEDMVWPLLLHYKYPNHEFYTKLLKFTQHLGENRKTCKSTWENRTIRHSILNEKTQLYKKEFEKGHFDMAVVKETVEREWLNEPKSELDKFLRIYTKW